MPRTSVFKPRTTLVEPTDQFPYKLGRESVPRRSTLYHGVDFEQVKHLTDNQLRKSVRTSKGDHERPSTSKDYQNSYPHRVSNEMFKEERVDYGKQIIDPNDYNTYEYNKEERLSYADPNQKTVVRFRPHSVAHSKPSALSRLMVFRADQIEHKLVLGKHVHPIPFKHTRPVPTLLTDDGKLLQPLPENYARKSILKPDKNSKTLDVGLTEIENVGQIHRKSVVLNENGVEDSMPAWRKSIMQDKNTRQSIRKSIQDGNIRKSMRRSVISNENMMRKSTIQEGNVKGYLRKSIPDGNFRSSVRKSVVQDSNVNVKQPIRSSNVQDGRRYSIPSSVPREEKRYSVIKFVSDDARNNQRQSVSHRGTDSNELKVPVIPARFNTSKSVLRHSIGPTTDPAYLDSKAMRNSRVSNWSAEESKRMSTMLNTPVRKRHSIVVLNVESQTNPFISKARHCPPSLVENENRIEPYSRAMNSQFQSSARNAGPVLHLRPSNYYQRKNLMEYDTESPMIKTYSEYYKHLNSPVHQVYTTQVLQPTLKHNEDFDMQQNQSLKKKNYLKNRITPDESKVQDFCGLTETQEINTSNLKSFSNIKRVPSALDNDIDSLCFPVGNYPQNNNNNRQSLRRHTYSHKAY